MKEPKNSSVLSHTKDRKLKHTLGFIIAIVAFCLYAQSLSFDYALDDFAVLKGNKLVEQGVKGIPAILANDRLFGAQENENSRTFEYRPASMVVFAIIWQFFPNNPHAFHLFSVLVYALSCWLLFRVLCKLFKNYTPLVPFCVALLFAAHPIHTEVVNNIKSLDEILCFLFALCSIYLFIRYLERNSILNFSVALLCFFISLLSKETGITFLIIVPLTLYFFTPIPLKKLAIVSVSLLAVSVLFFLIRANIFENVTAANDNLSYLNSLYAAPNFIGREATAFYILLKYILLLIIPHSFSYDYSIAQIPNLSITSLSVISSILIHSALLVYALFTIKKKNPIAFGILFYLITLAPVSNIFILIRWTMAERFLFIPSLGFCLILVLLLWKLTKTSLEHKSFNSLMQLLSTHKKALSVVVLLCGAYSLQTISRNPVWKNNETLFRHDVKVVPNSARSHYNYGLVLYDKFFQQTGNKNEPQQLLDTVIQEFTTSISLHANAFTYKFLAKAYFYKADLQNAITNYELAIKYYTTPDPESYSNLGLLYTKTDRYDKALQMFDLSLKCNPHYTDARINKADVYLKQGRNQDALAECNQVLSYDARNEKALLVKGIAYLNLKLFDAAITYASQALAIDSTDATCLKVLGIAYQQKGDADKANRYFGKQMLMQHP